MRRIYPLILLLLSTSFTILVCGQKTETDSLLNEFSKAKSDTQKLNLLNHLIAKSDSAHGVKYANDALYLADRMIAAQPSLKKILLTKKATTYRNLSALYNRSVDKTNAIDCLGKAITVLQQTNNKKHLYEAYDELALIYTFIGDVPNALDFFSKSLKLAEELRDTPAIASLTNDIGFVYGTNGEADASLLQHKKAMELFSAIGDEAGLSSTLNNVGMQYYKEKDFVSAEKYFLQSLAIREKLNLKPGLAVTYNNLGGVYRAKGDLNNAMVYFKKSLALRRELKDFLSVSQSLNNISQLYTTQGQWQKARIYVDSALSLAKQYKSPGFIISAERQYARVDSALGNFESALYHYQQYVLYNDSVNRESNRKAVLKTQIKYEFEKKQEQVKAEQDKKDALSAKELQRQKLFRNSFIAGFAVMLLFAGVFFFQRNKIGKEKKRSEDLLLNILPKEVAEELKEKGSAEAKLFENVTVFFSDFKGFTTVSEKLSPQELVNELHECFTAFDNIMQKHNIEKIKTVGDAYLAVSGVPTANPNHAEDVVKAAIEICEYMKTRSNKELSAVRIGIHSGHVVAGIVGVKKFAYDIWGDTVNTAARMEQNGEAGKVNISEATYELVKDKFNTEFRGEIEAKNKGKLKMYFVG